MRHLIGRLIAGLAVEGRAGVSKPRPCPRVAWGVAVSLLAHAVAIALTWHTAPPRKPVKEPARLSVRLASSPPRAAATTQPAAAPMVARRDAERQVAPSAKSAQRARAAHTAHPALAAKAAQPARVAKAAPPPATAESFKPPAAEAPTAPAEAIDGSVFALPHIGIGGSAPPRWMKPQGPPAMAAPPFMPPPAMHAHAAHEAGRMQIVLALQRQVGAWQAPDDASDGRCALHARPDGHLDCDNAALQQAVGAQAASLSALLEAYRSIDPSASSLSIAYQQGRYQVSLASASPR